MKILILLVAFVASATAQPAGLFDYSIFQANCTTMLTADGTFAVPLALSGLYCAPSITATSLRNLIIYSGTATPGYLLFQCTASYNSLALAALTYGSACFDNQAATTIQALNQLVSVASLFCPNESQTLNNSIAPLQSASNAIVAVHKANQYGIFPLNNYCTKQHYYNYGTALVGCNNNFVALALAYFALTQQAGFFSLSLSYDFCQGTTTAVATHAIQCPVQAALLSGAVQVPINNLVIAFQANIATTTTGIAVAYGSILTALVVSQGTAVVSLSTQNAQSHILFTNSLYTQCATDNVQYASQLAQVTNDFTTQNVGVAGFGFGGTCQGGIVEWNYYGTCLTTDIFNTYSSSNTNTCMCGATATFNIWQQVNASIQAEVQCVNMTLQDLKNRTAALQQSITWMLQNTTNMVNQCASGNGPRGNANETLYVQTCQVSNCHFYNL